MFLILHNLFYIIYFKINFQNIQVNVVHLNSKFVNYSTGIIWESDTNTEVEGYLVIWSDLFS